MISAVGTCISYQAGLGRAPPLDQDELAEILAIMHVEHSSDLLRTSSMALSACRACQPQKLHWEMCGAESVLTKHGGRLVALFVTSQCRQVAKSGEHAA
jgi:hypothetical protein